VPGSPKAAPGVKAESGCDATSWNPMGQPAPMEANQATYKQLSHTQGSASVLFNQKKPFETRISISTKKCGNFDAHLEKKIEF